MTLRSQILTATGLLLLMLVTFPPILLLAAWMRFGSIPSIFPL